MDVQCPECKAWCQVPIEAGDLAENSTTEGFEWDCACGCSFTFDVYVDLMNKTKKQEI